MSVRGTGALHSVNARRQSTAQGGGQVQLLAIPQLDAIQRSLKLLDVRLQHVQSNANDDQRMRDDVEHIRHIMSENQKVLHTIVTVLSSVQEEVRYLSVAVQKQQQNTLQIVPHRKKSNESKVTNSSDDREKSSPLTKMEQSQV